jgi:VWFA-related protein
VILTLLATATLTGQTRPVQPPPPPAPQSQSAQLPRFTSQVDLVTLDVIVRDKNGQFVPDLTKADFTVLEDGVEQNMADFRLMYGGRELSVEMIHAPTAAPEGMILPPTRPVADVAGRVFIIFIDDLHLLASDSPRVRQLLTQITNT